MSCSTPMFAFPPRFKPFLRTLFQIGLLILIWLVAVELSARWLHQIPPTVSGIAIALALLGLGLLKREWLADGSAWLLREMLLFFIPVVIAVLQYQQMLDGKLLSILLVIIGSTACVMIATALAVDLAWRLEARWRKPTENKE
ncbi:CidA/LrgA family protein [Uliginosibacterium sp. 31-16]|uniref:CidA/LrgA family protein n=1 Tax=Uliginosibacterium sp. 31-16 TaxID=3068315 RepID=UPI00273D1C4A|nr:CidA/LrgA family protein [Uliginosibacterium sp. 31-16]MDP5239541.1 CidA/LrgA family protein [Uliginosibacterium sp. 31-16]